MAASLTSGCGLLFDFDPHPDASGFDGGPSLDSSVGDGGSTCMPGPCGMMDDPSICIRGRCVQSRCGDGVVDLRIEDCEGETAGCARCRFVCRADTDCRNGPQPECRGEVTCDLSAHTCVATPVTDDTPCVGGHCMTGRCVPQGCGDGVTDSGEECDDGNTLAGDGCEPDCHVTCGTDEDCSDGNVCNGDEVCHGISGGSGHNCQAGTPPTLTACQICDSVQGPITPDADGDGVPPMVSDGCMPFDCDDTNPNRYPGATEVCDGIDNNCNEVVDEGLGMGALTCYPDDDSDGFPAMDGSVTMDCTCGTSCMCPTGRVTVSTSSTGRALFDCNDDNSDAHPGQTAFFDTPHCTACALPYDYNCDGVDEQEDTRVVNACRLILGNCNAQGWATAAPACGDTGTFRMCHPLLPLLICGIGSADPGVQGCR